MRGHTRAIAACERQAAADAARTAELEALLEELQNRSAATGERRGVVTGRLNAMAPHYGFKGRGRRRGVVGCGGKKTPSRRRGEGAANAALTRAWRSRSAETDAFLQDAVERPTRP